MAGRGRGRPPKKKAEDRAKGSGSKNRSISPLSAFSSSSISDEETLDSLQVKESQPRKKSVLSNWIEEATKSKETRTTNKKEPPLKAGGRDTPTRSGNLIKISNEDVVDEIAFWESSVSTNTTSHDGDLLNQCSRRSGYIHCGSKLGSWKAKRSPKWLTVGLLRQKASWVSPLKPASKVVGHVNSS